MLEWDEEQRRYGASFVLAGEGGQDSQGHPQIWEENGRSYMGYDYVDAYEHSRIDRMGIRELPWVDGWPTIWTPITVYLGARETRSLAGRELAISLSSDGDPVTVAGFDKVSLVTGTRE